MYLTLSRLLTPTRPSRVKVLAPPRRPAGGPAPSLSGWQAGEPLPVSARTCQPGPAAGPLAVVLVLVITRHWHCSEAASLRPPASHHDQINIGLAFNSQEIGPARCQGYPRAAWARGPQFRPGVLAPTAPKM